MSELAYGKKHFNLDSEQLHVQEIVHPNPVDITIMSPEDAVRDALTRPINSAPLPDLVKEGDKICVIVPDITRAYETPSVSLPILLNQLHQGGVKAEDIVILCATGTHRRMTAEEHIQLLGKDIAAKYRLVDHQCGDMADMRQVGETSRGTPVWFNRHAVDADKIVTLCGVVYHFLAGFGGGGKMLLPGVAARQTIQANHELALNPGFGNGHNPQVRSGNITDSNPFHADIFEAASMLPPIFSLNVVVNDAPQIVAAFAGNWQDAHARACKLVARMEGVAIGTRADFIIASAGGSPRDINLYQSVKLTANALEAANPGALLILLTECPEGFGNDDTRRLICDYDNMKDRERDLRSSFSIGSFVGYYMAETAEKNAVILVTSIPADNFKNTRITAVSSLEEAMRLARGKKQYAQPCILMPHGASTFPIPRQ